MKCALVYLTLITMVGRIGDNKVPMLVDIGVAVCSISAGSVHSLALSCEFYS